MSKKIIYLLSLLMALSLVFASCKKNSVTDALNTGGLKPPTDTGQGQEDAGDDGLFNDYAKIPDGEIANTGVYVTTDGNYYRNPVVVARPDGKLFVFAEKRWRSDGSGNDVGIDGINTTDVIYKVSTDGGYKFDTQEYTVGGDALKAKGPDNSHGAPVVFVKDNNIVVVATSGSGIGRTTQKTVEAKPSKIDYITGTINGDKITWGNTWKEVKIGNDSIVTIAKKTSAGGNQGQNFNQVATPPSRGFVDNNSMMYLDLVLAYQGEETPKTSTYELMGRMTIKGTIGSDTITWSKVEDAVAYTTDTVKLGPWKETKLVSSTGDVNDSSYTHLVVPSPWTEPANLRPWLLGTGANNQNTINKTSIKASEGSVGYFITKDKWFGSQAYKITGTEGAGDTQISGDGTTGQQMGVLVHVQQTASQLYLYRVNKDLQMQGSKGWKLDDVGKSSSVDMMADGTIVIAAEKGGAEKNYFIRLLRYSQKYIEEQTK